MLLIFWIVQLVRYRMLRILKHRSAMQTWRTSVFWWKRSKIREKLSSYRQESVQSFKETVQKEVTSYAGVVASSCATATNCSETYSWHWRQEQKYYDTEDRGRNIMTLKTGAETLWYWRQGQKPYVCSLAEKSGKDIFSQLGEKPMFSIPCRVEKPVSGSVRPVKVSFPSASVVPALVKNLQIFVNRTLASLLNYGHSKSKFNTIRYNFSSFTSLPNPLKRELCWAVVRGLTLQRWFE